MKLILVLAAVAAVALAAPQLSDEQKQRLEEHHKKCQEEAPLDDSVLEKIRKHEKVETRPENWGKHALCMAKAVGTIDADGKVNKEKLEEIIKHFPGSTDEKVKEVVDACAKEYEPAEETAVKLADCIKEHK